MTAENHSLTIHLDVEGRGGTRRLVTFRRVGEADRGQEEIHRQQLFEEASIAEMFESMGFEVHTMRSYGDDPLGQGVVGFVGRKA